VPHDPVLADRLREALVGEPVVERRMFGGVAFLLGGHLAVCASSTGGLLLRCAPEETETHTAAAGVERFVMRGRPMTGWLDVPADVVAGDEELARWVAVGTAYAGSLPPT
jgi:hypothetical protein